MVGIGGVRSSKYYTNTIQMLYKYTNIPMSGICGVRGRPCALVKPARPPIRPTPSSNILYMYHPKPNYYTNSMQMFFKYNPTIEYNTNTIQMLY